MKRSLLASVAAAALASGVAQAHDVHMSCDVESRFSLTTSNGAHVFSQESGRPGHVTLDHHDLIVDGHKATLSVDDQARVQQLHAEIDALMPQSQQIATEAINIAFDALGEVAKALASHPRETLARLDRSRAEALREMDARPLFLFSHGDHTIDAIIEPVMTEFVPEIAGGAVSMAFRAIFASEHERDAIEARMNRMETDIDQKVDARAEALEPLADAMCQRLKRMDSLEDALDYRLPDGGRLELLSFDRKVTAKTP